MRKQLTRILIKNWKKYKLIIKAVICAKDMLYMYTLDWKKKFSLIAKKNRKVPMFMLIQT